MNEETPSMPAPSVAPRPFLQRWLIGTAAAAGLVVACTVSLQMHVLRDPAQLLAVCVGVLMVAIPSAAVVALAVRRSELGLVLGSQLLVVVFLAAWSGMRI
ncbi:hypothetical protein [Pseudoxanthomonas daejeonensis]|uniref:hypothetical protein n=1 Tax=Pseudoxanthomonas daejeonensis TaxID=266062 RepID=UPI001391C569|nr:hypothetical protein [Pseudoxanthomonas daejeonensis]